SKFSDERASRGRGAHESSSQQSANPGVISMASTTTSQFANTTHEDSIQDKLALIGRILIAYLFVPSGIGKLIGFAGTVGYITSAGLPLPGLGAVIGVVVEIGFGVALLIGYKTRWTAIVLA